MKLTPEAVGRFLIFLQWSTTAIDFAIALLCFYGVVATTIGTIIAVDAYLKRLSENEPAANPNVNKEQVLGKTTIDRF